MCILWRLKWPWTAPSVLKDESMSTEYVNIAVRFLNVDFLEIRIYALFVSRVRTVWTEMLKSIFAIQKWKWKLTFSPLSVSVQLWKRIYNMICVVYLLLSLFFTEEYTFCIKTAGIVMAKLLFEFPVRVHYQPNNTAE